MDFGYFLVGLIGYGFSILALGVSGVSLRDAIRALGVDNEQVITNAVISAQALGAAAVAAVLTRTILGAFDAGIGRVDVGQLMVGLIGYGFAALAVGNAVCALTGWLGQKKDDEEVLGGFAAGFVAVCATRFVIFLMG